VTATPTNIDSTTVCVDARPLLIGGHPEAANAVLCDLVSHGLLLPAAVPAHRDALALVGSSTVLLLVGGEADPHVLKPICGWIEESDNLVLAVELEHSQQGSNTGRKARRRANTPSCQATLSALAKAGAVVTPGTIGAIEAALRTSRRCHTQTAELQQELSLLRKTQQQADTWLAQIDEELHMAARVQREMLGHKPPTIPGLEVGAIFRPVWHVSGDIYSMAAREGGLTFVLADAMGHGLGAAMHSMIITHELLCSNMSETPGRALARLNRQMCASATERVRFATAVYGHIDPGSRTAHLAVAGHHAPLLLRDGRVIDTEPDGAILGVFPDAEFVEASVHLLPGDTLIVFSDGVEQACMDAAKCREDHRADEYRRLLSGTLCCERPLQDGVERLLDVLTTQRSSLHQNDDLTVLAFRYTG
jgi:phosphoserine phosphatase RsbU/P